MTTTSSQLFLGASAGGNDTCVIDSVPRNINFEGGGSSPVHQGERRTSYLPTPSIRGPRQSTDRHQSRPGPTGSRRMTRSARPPSHRTAPSDSGCVQTAPAADPMDGTAVSRSVQRLLEKSSCMLSHEKDQVGTFSHMSEHVYGQWPTAFQ